MDLFGACDLEARKDGHFHFVQGGPKRIDALDISMIGDTDHLNAFTATDLCKLPVVLHLGEVLSLAPVLQV